MSTRYGVINDELWDLDMEEPVSVLNDTDAEDEAYIEELLQQALLNLEDGWPYTEEPVELLTDRDAEDAELLAVIDDLDDDAFLDAVLHGVIHHVF